jgi:hypothetical protein
LEADIVAARAGTVVPPMQPDGTPRAMKWEKLNAYNFDVYKKVVDTVFNFRRVYKLPLNKDVAVHCVGVDTSVKSLRNTGAGDIGVGFDKEFHFLRRHSRTAIPASVVSALSRPPPSNDAAL